MPIQSSKALVVDDRKGLRRTERNIRVSIDVIPVRLPGRTSGE